MNLDPIEGFKTFETRNGSVEVLVVVFPGITDRLCAVCNGVRKSTITLINQVELAGAHVDGQLMVWDKFAQDHADQATDVQSSLLHSKWESPLCIPCMADNYKPNRKMNFPEQKDSDE